MSDMRELTIDNAILSLVSFFTVFDDIADIQTVEPIAVKQKLAVNYLRYR